MRKYIDIIFDGPPDSNSGRFVEVEDENGRSITVGEWMESDKMWALRLTPTAFDDSHFKSERQDNDKGK